MAEVTGHLLVSGTEVVESQAVPIQNANDASGPHIALHFLMLCDVHGITLRMERAGTGTGGSSH